MNLCCTVVNWFQIVFLRENSQVLHQTKQRLLSCELISNCIFTWEFTRHFPLNRLPLGLWIDFKLYFYVRIHKCALLPLLRAYVVNWFQIVFLRENSQEPKVIDGTTSGCELISNCIFTWEFTRLNKNWSRRA